MPLWPFYGQLRSLDFDLDRWVWTDGSQLFDHSVKKGRNLLNNRESLQPKMTYHTAPKLQHKIERLLEEKSCKEGCWFHVGFVPQGD